METEVHFRETQQFDQPWLWGLLALRALADLLALARRKRTLGETARRLAALGAAALFLRVARLDTEVRDDGLYVKFAPLHRSAKRVAFADLADVQETGYSPMRYGGWGLRWTPSGTAYTVRGTGGVRFERAGGRSLVVGSERPDELVAAVQEATDRTV
ncbi:hypothetical protein M0R88_00055 [Halorussus gelatinilyticus]|uniref:Uncharacterized protein n=1 Tax=Halorussus gelatinilyticus TaxID=2937524 RepID=A0A8U0IHN8_9EURY|nr:hypothetical protein [Halorussus gelatinilyticus]UPW00513.1 hypothetical protein M0R88_00055 [Halorussus gelatinilyticus]